MVIVPKHSIEIKQAYVVFYNLENKFLGFGQFNYLQ